MSDVSKSLDRNDIWAQRRRFSSFGRRVSNLDLVNKEELTKGREELVGEGTQVC